MRAEPRIDYGVFVPPDWHDSLMYTGQETEGEDRQLVHVLPFNSDASPRM